MKENSITTEYSATTIDTSIHEAEEEYASDGILIDARAALSDLRLKHFNTTSNSSL